MAIFNKIKHNKKGVEGAIGQTTVHILVWITVLAVMFPFLLTLLFSFKSLADFNRGFWALPENYNFANYSYSLNIIGLNMFNSIFYTLIICFVSLSISALSAYVFTRYNFRGKKILFSLIISMMMVPFVLTITPSYLLILNLNLRNTMFALILPAVSISIVGGIFLFNAFRGQQPAESY